MPNPKQQAYLINSLTRTIEPFSYLDYTGLTAHLSGGLSVAAQFETGDVLYVDDEGMMKPATCAFRIRQRQDGQPMMGMGVMTGRDDPHSDATLPPAMTIEQLQAEIEWLDLDAALNWFRERATKGAVTFTSLDHEGNATEEVISTYGSFLDMMERKAGD